VGKSTREDFGGLIFLPVGVTSGLDEIHKHNSTSERLEYDSSAVEVREALKTPSGRKPPATVWTSIGELLTIVATTYCSQDNAGKSSEKLAELLEQPSSLNLPLKQVPPCL
jgi:hypothetical protein